MMYFVDEYLDEHFADHPKKKKIRKMLRKEVEYMERELFYIDNFRLAQVGQKDQEEEYEQARRDGCCGSHEAQVRVAGYTFWVGCNYGH